VRVRVQAELSYSHMKVQHKSDDKLTRNFSLRYASFVVEYASHLTLSAADHVHVLWAHLTSATAKGKSCSQLTDGFWCARGPTQRLLRNLVDRYTMLATSTLACGVP
jgi:hypothetical protein